MHLVCFSIEILPLFLRSYVTFVPENERQNYTVLGTVLDGQETGPSLHCHYECHAGSLTVLNEKYKIQNSSLCSLFHSFTTPTTAHFMSSIPIHTLFSNALNWHSYLSVTMRYR